MPGTVTMRSSTHAPTVVIVDDQTVFRELLAEVLAADGLDVVGQFGRGSDALRACERLKPDAVVLDVMLPDMSGLDVLRALVRLVRGVSVLIVTAHEKPTIVREAVERGARGVFAKGSSLRELKEGVRRVTDGGVAFCATSLALLHHGIQEPHPDVELSARERQVLQLVASGLTSKEIASELKIAEKTVINHRTNIRDKLGVREIAGLTRYAIDRGIVVPRS